MTRHVSFTRAARATYRGPGPYLGSPVPAGESQADSLQRAFLHEQAERQGEAQGRIDHRRRHEASAALTLPTFDG
eukprot:6970442-Prymnesium_polylepis.1